MATFPVFGQFLVDLSKRNPEIADRCFARGDEDLLGFLPALLNGLAESAAEDIYNKNLEDQLTLGTHLTSLARHLRSDSAPNPASADRVLAKAISAQDDIAVMECLVLVMERFGTGVIDNEEELFRSSMEYLNQKRNAHWVRGAWFQPKIGQFFSRLSEDNAKLLLTNLGPVRKLSNRLLIELDIGLQPPFHTIYCGGDRYRTHQRAVFGGGPVSR
jgi:hypothetical protein